MQIGFSTRRRTRFGNLCRGINQGHIQVVYMVYYGLIAPFTRVSSLLLERGGRKEMTAIWKERVS